jgi:hypothetical protein
MNALHKAGYNAQRAAVRCRCGVLLTGGLDTYGDQHEPMCQACWFDPVVLEDDGQRERPLTPPAKSDILDSSTERGRED